MAETKINITLTKPQLAALIVVSEWGLTAVKAFNLTATTGLMEQAINELKKAKPR